MSSSRVQISFTGAPTAFDASTAAGMKSTSRRRPNPPPSKVVIDVDAVWPAVQPRRPAAACAICCTCVPDVEIAAVRLDVGRAIHRLHGRMRQQRQLIHGVKGLRRRLERRRRIAVGAARAARGSGGRASAAARRIAALSSRALAPGSQVIFKASRALQRLPEMIRDHDHAARGRAAPGALRASPRAAARVDRLCALPPNTGLCAIAAYSIPGSFTSMPNSALPSTLPGVSSRACGLPIKPKICSGLELDLLGNRQLRGRRGQLAVADSFCPRAFTTVPFDRVAFRRVDAPCVAAAADQHHARRAPRPCAASPRRPARCCWCR